VDEQCQAQRECHWTPAVWLWFCEPPVVTAAATLPQHCGFEKAGKTTYLAAMFCTPVLGNNLLCTNLHERRRKRP